MIPPPISHPAPPNPFCRGEKMQKLTISCRGTLITNDYLGGDYEEECEDLFSDLADCLASEDPTVRSLGFSEAKENFGSAIWQARRDPIEGVERKRTEEVERLKLENHKLKQVDGPLSVTPPLLQAMGKQRSITPSSVPPQQVLGIHSSAHIL